MNLLVILHVAVTFVWQMIYAYTRGLWFLIWHPILFIDFIEEWKGYRQHIEVNDNQQLGRATTNRKQRRNMGFR